MARPTTTRSGCGPATATASPNPAPRRGRRAARVLSLLCAVAMPLALLPPQVGWVPPIPQVILLQPALAALALGLAVIALVRRDLPSLVMSGLGIILFLAIWVMPVWPTSAHESVSSAGQAESQPSAGAPAADAATMASDELTIMTINTHVGQADPAQILQLVRDHQVDVLCVQESTVAFARALADAGASELLPYRAGEEIGDIVWSALPLGDPADDAVGYAGAAMAAGTIEALGTRLRVVSVHTCSPTPGYERLWAESLADVANVGEADPGAQPDVPYVLAGDFNATRAHAALRDVLAAGFTDAATSVSPLPLATWPRLGPLSGFAPIDHVLTPAGIVATDVMRVHVGDTDHCGLIVTLRAAS